LSHPGIYPPVSSDLSAPKLQVVGFGPRALAYVIDLVPMYALSWLLGKAALAIVPRLLLAQAEELTGLAPAQRLETMLLGLVLETCFFGLFEWLYGATPGKLILQMRVVMVDGRRCGLWAAAIRGLIRWVDFLFFGIPAAISMSRNTDRQQRLGDRAAHTLVVDRRGSSIQPRSWSWLALAVVLYLIAGTALACADKFAFGRVKAGPLPVPVAVSAADANLTVDDLGPGFKLDREVLRAGFKIPNFKDANQRTFVSDGLMIQSRVVTYPFGPTDSLASMQTAIENGLHTEISDGALTYGDLSQVNFGDRGGLFSISNDTTGLQGYALFFFKQNAFVWVFAYGRPQQLQAGQIEALAGAIDGRLR